MVDRFDSWEHILGTRTASQLAARKEGIEALKNELDDLLHLLESDVISSRLPVKERNIVVETLRRTVRSQGMKLERANHTSFSCCTIYSSTKERVSTFLLICCKTKANVDLRENVSFDMGDMCRDIWNRMKKMIPGEFTEPMIWALCSKISSSVNISTLEMRKLKAGNGNKYVKPMKLLFPVMFALDSDNACWKGRRKVLRGLYATSHPENNSRGTKGKS